METPCGKIMAPISGSQNWWSTMVYRYIYIHEHTLYLGQKPHRHILCTNPKVYLFHIMCCCRLCFCLSDHQLISGHVFSGPVALMGFSLIWPCSSPLKYIVFLYTYHEKHTHNVTYSYTHVLFVQCTYLHVYIHTHSTYINYIHTHIYSLHAVCAA